MHGFNPRSRMGSDFNGHRISSGLNVSIHAPAWGATFLFGAIWTEELVSIHAPAWGATWPEDTCFCRCDVSIHAPAWGATAY